MIFNAIVPDHNAGAFQTIEPSETKPGDAFASFLLSGFSRWDAQYFLHISQHGYTHENCLAFLPLYPNAISIVARSLQPLFQSVLNSYSIYLLSGSLINLVAFVIATRSLYELTVWIFNDAVLANLSVLLFCINPASIFFSACYSETAFSCLTFASIFFLERRLNFIGASFVGLSILARSNGLTLIPLIVYLDLKHFLHDVNLVNGTFRRLKFVIGRLARLIASLVLAVLPYILYQFHIYGLFCASSDKGDIPEEIIRFAKVRGYKLSSDADSPPWCSWTLPSSYSYVQSTYWNVGLFRYYELKQIPNFILAIPAITISSYEILSYVRSNWKIVWSFGLAAGEPRKNASLFVYVVHLAGLLVTCILVVHIQVCFCSCLLDFGKLCMFTFFSFFR